MTVKLFILLIGSQFSFTNARRLSNRFLIPASRSLKTLVTQFAGYGSEFAIKLNFSIETFVNLLNALIVNVV
jgi:hypothetical protein